MILWRMSGNLGAMWLSGRVLDSRPRGRELEPHRRHCAVSLRKNISPSLVLVKPRKTSPFITERLLMGRKESNQINKNGNYTIKLQKSVISLEIFYAMWFLSGTEYGC